MGVAIFGGGDEFVGPHCSPGAPGWGAMPTLNWVCRHEKDMGRGHESGDNPSSPKSMATPEPTQDMDSTRRVAMAPCTWRSVPEMTTPLHELFCGFFLDDLSRSTYILGRFIDPAPAGIGDVA